MPYVFYDTETTGTDTAFDQILQFAAIETDDDLNEIQRLNIRCRLLPHVVPSPGALRVNSITPAMLTDPNLPSHYEAMLQIHGKLMEWSPAVFVGYNSIGFDENILRQAFFQTLQPAYLTNTNGNSRADVMRIAHATRIYAPDSISVPVNDRGNETFRLELLAPANGYNHDAAHEAMADVEATIFLAKLARDRAPEIWQAMDRATVKNTVKKYVASQTMFSLTERYFGRAFSWLVTPCGQNPDYDSQLGVFDLHFDPDDYLSMSAEELVRVLSANQKPIRTLRANAQPIMMPADAAPEGVKALDIAPDEVRRRISAVQNDKEFQARVGQALAMRFADKEPSPYVEEQIYDGFPDAADRVLMEQFHNAVWADRVALAGRIKDLRLSEFAWRLIYFERRNLLPAAKAADLDTWLAQRVLTTDEAVPWKTVGKALRETDDFLANASGDEAVLLQEVKDYLHSVAERLGSS